MTNTFVYYGLSLNSVAVAGNLYLNFMLVCLIEVPAGLATWMLMERVGRRASMCSSLVLTGVSCIAFLFVPNTEGAPNSTLCTVKCYSEHFVTHSPIKWGKEECGVSPPQRNKLS